ncbi:type I polyketide synthase [Streptomyces sp. NPDC050255]|uniref:type I polyketide synthase n=1 Tax=Streptomyces sp. NPDC050255 TaxID=3365606 RepID=UPI00378C375D
MQATQLPPTPPAGEAVAVVGLACRFPGAANSAAFWRLLIEGRDAVAAPVDHRAGRAAAGYVTGVDLFDAELFGISAREATAMDPQQRLLLELAWQAMEDARIAPDSLHGSDTGVFVGACADDYGLLSRAAGSPAMSPYTLTGTGRAFLANRLSYTFGLHGPSLTTDTGQSSSLVAIHQAAESLRRGECERALAGGIQLNLAAESDAAVEALGALSPTGRCRTFDARADGIVRGEGGGVLVLRTLSRAMEDGDRIYCTLLGGAVNNDGHGAGLTAPGQEPQQQVVSRAYKHAGVEPRDVAYVELHGTGTRAGDPVEAAALGSVLGSGRPAGSPLLVGSVKTNIGHLEGAAGVAGFVKTALSLFHREVPPTLHHQTLNPAIDPQALGLRVCVKRSPWPAGRPLTAGVSSFGLGGTNCHVVLGEPPRAPLPQGRTLPGTLPWVLSGHTAAALRGQAARLADLVEDDTTVDPAALGLSLASTRARLRHGAAVLGGDAATLAAALRAVSRGERAEGVLGGLRGKGATAFLLPGQGMQRQGMGRELHRAHPAFARSFDEISAAMEPALGLSLREVMWHRDDWLDRLTYAQPALFAVEVSLCRLLESWGITPDYLVGHSQGEITAAHIAGILSMEDAAAFVVERGRLIGTLPPGGAMVALQAEEAEVRAAIEARAPGSVGIAAINSPRSLVVSGQENGVDAVAEQFGALGRRVRRLRIGVAGHSPLMDPIREELLAAAQRMTFHQPTGPVIVSSVTGQVGRPGELGTPEYWADHLCATVRFGAAVRTAHELGARFFAEAGPGHGLTTMAEEVAGGGGEVFTTPLATTDELGGVAEVPAAAHLFGRPVDWRAVYGSGVPLTDLPAYAFQRRPYWLGTAEGAPAATGAPARPADVTGLVLGLTLDVLGRPRGTRLDPDQSFNDMGIDSRMALTLRNRLAQDLGAPLPATLLFDFPTPAGLIEALRPEFSR